MRNLKSFKLFESKTEIDIDAICSLYEDVKSIEYILEEKGISPSYRLRVTCIPHGSLQKEVRILRVRSCDEIRGFLNRATVVLKEFFIHIENWSKRKPVIAREDIKRFKNLLEEHLDYLPEESIEFVDGVSYYKIGIKI